MQLTCGPNWYTYDYGWNRDAGNKYNANGRTNKHTQSPQKLLLTAPGFLTPEGAARGTKIVKIGYLFHAKPTEFGFTNAARHMIARSIVHLDNSTRAYGALLDIFGPECCT